MVSRNAQYPVSRRQFLKLSALGASAAALAACAMPAAAPAGEAGESAAALLCNLRVVTWVQKAALCSRSKL